MIQRPLIAATVLLLAACDSGGGGGNMTAEEVAEEMSGMKMRPGQWSATNEIVSASAPGLPAEALKQMTGQKTTVSSCLTPEQAANPQANFLAAQKDTNCTYQDWSMEGGKMQGTMVCEGEGMPGKMTMKMAGTYGEESYDMTMDMTTSGAAEGASFTFKARAVGRRTGECEAQPETKG